VDESGSIFGLSTFIITGIGKSTPIRIASPAPRTGKKSNELLFAEELAFAIDSLSK
jgi:hypothetical protein